MKALGLCPWCGEMVPSERGCVPCREKREKRDLTPEEIQAACDLIRTGRTPQQAVKQNGGVVPWVVPEVKSTIAEPEAREYQ